MDTSDKSPMTREKITDAHLVEKGFVNFVQAQALLVVKQSHTMHPLNAGLLPDALKVFHTLQGMGCDHEELGWAPLSIHD